jgi:uncharacterized protein (DUF488 family)
VVLYTIGFTGTSAAEFFGRLRRAGIQRVLDVRLHNTSQLAGFSKRADLAFFLEEICEADYRHEPMLAPSEEVFRFLKKERGSWDEYGQRFLDLMDQRRIADVLDRDLIRPRTALLCSEPTAEQCHRRLVAEYLQTAWGGFEISHI